MNEIYRSQCCPRLYYGGIEVTAVVTPIDPVVGTGVVVEAALTTPGDQAANKGTHLIGPRSQGSLASSQARMVGEDLYLLTVTET